MKLEKKIVAMLLVVLLTLSIVACGEKDDAKKPADSAETKTETNESKDPTKTEISTETEGVVTTEEVLTDSPVSITTEPMKTEEELGIDLSDYEIRQMIKKGLILISEGKGEELAKYAPSFTPESWLQSERYTASEGDGTTIDEVIKIDGIQLFSQETILDFYEHTMLGFEIENPEALKDVESIAAFHYTSQYTTADGQEEYGEPNGLSDFLMAYEGGKWKFVFVDDVPDSILNYNLNCNRDFYLGEYKFKSDAIDDVEFADGDDWVLNIDTLTNEQGDSFLQVSLKGDGQEWRDIYFLQYATMDIVQLCKEYDSDNDVFLDYTLEVDTIQFLSSGDSLYLVVVDTDGRVYHPVFVKTE